MHLFLQIVALRKKAMTVNKRLISILILVCFFLSCTVIASADEITAPVSLSIESTEDFIAFAENCRLDSFSQGLTVSLEADIDLSETDFNGIPIFCGEFLGNGHTVSGINLQAYGSTVGLFRYLTETACISDLHVAGILTPKGSAVTVGGIVGSNAGTITDCTFTGTINGTDEIGGIAGINTVTGSIMECSVSGNIIGNHFVGGIAGTNNGIIQNCTNAAPINTEYKQNDVNLSDITIENLTGSESAGTVTDIGGIAGTSSGHIRFCKNTADIGYIHVGYNIGGIAGSQSGFLADCENTGVVSGRKEVGGIVGQLEPVIIVTYSTDTLQILEGQLNTLSSLAGSISANLNTTASGIRNQLVTIQGQIESAKDSFSKLLPNPDSENPIPDVEAVPDAIKELTDTLSSISGSLNSILKYTENASWAINRDLQAMSNTISSMQQTLGSATDTIGGSVSDASDDDTEEDLTAKITRCTNAGTVQGDLNCGGITGAICLENDLDPEDDIMLFGEISLNFAGTYRAVVTDCSNLATVSAKKQYAGGITGLATLGLIRSCTNTGTLNCPNADYVGGIAGFSDASVRDSSSKAQIHAVSYAGGISGCAHTVSDCRAMSLLSAQESIGGIVGSAPEVTQITRNYYLPIGHDVGAIDGVSYNAVAQALNLEEFLALDNLPDFFSCYQVTFLQEDGSKTILSLKTGEQLTEDLIPEISPKAGHKGSWAGITETMCFDTIVTASYTPYQQVIQSEQNRDNGLPVLLAVGSFSEDDQVLIKKSNFDNALEGWSVSLPQNAKSIRFLPPVEFLTSELSVLIRSEDGQWLTKTHVLDGSYLVLTVDATDFDLCIIKAEGNNTGLFLTAGALFIVITSVIVYFALLRRRKKQAPASEDNKDS